MALTLSGSLGTHDPVAMLAGGRFYLFNTANGIGTKTAPAVMGSWAQGSSALGNNASAYPSWIAQSVPGVSNLWAPDISYFGGMYHLYYSASTFGSNRSCIGHATQAALDSGTWADQGSVVCSNPGGGNSDNWNAIDPNVVIDDAGQAVAVVRQLLERHQAGAPDPGGRARRHDAVRDREPPEQRRRARSAVHLQALRHVLPVRVVRPLLPGGRQQLQHPRRPIDERDGTLRRQGGDADDAGGRQLLVQGDTRWHGPGHNAILVSGNLTYNVYHSYDANANGQSILRISELHWDAQGWPVSGGPYQKDLEPSDHRQPARVRRDQRRHREVTETQLGAQPVVVSVDGAHGVGQAVDHGRQGLRSRSAATSESLGIAGRSICVVESRQDPLAC